MEVNINYCMTNTYCYFLLLFTVIVILTGIVMMLRVRFIVVFTVDFDYVFLQNVLLIFIWILLLKINYVHKLSQRLNLFL